MYILNKDGSGSGSQTKIILNNKDKKMVTKNKLSNEATIVYMIFPKVFDASIRYFEAKTDFSVPSVLTADIYETEEYVERLTYISKMSKQDAMFSDGANIGSEIWIHGFENTIGLTDWTDDFSKFTRLMKAFLSLLTQRDFKYGTKGYYELMEMLGIKLRDENGKELHEAKFDEGFEYFIKTQFDKIQLMEELKKF